MLKKIVTVLVIVNTIGLLGIFGCGFYAYKYVNSGNFEKLIKSNIMGDIQSALPSAIEDKLPSITGKSIPLPCLLYTSPSPRDLSTSRMPSSA